MTNSPKNSAVLLIHCPDKSGIVVAITEFIYKNDGNILYLAADWSNSPVDIYSLDPSGNGSITKIGVLPFTTSYLTPSVRYSEDEVLIMSNGGELWSMDISTATPTFEQIAPGRANKSDIWPIIHIVITGFQIIVPEIGHDLFHATFRFS